MMRSPLWSLVPVWALMAVPAPAFAQDAAEMARTLAELRTEVESLSETYALEQEALRADLRAFEVRKAEAEARVRQEERRLEELERTIERQREILQADDVAEEVLTPVVLEALTAVRTSITEALPYRTQERLDAVEALRVEVEGGNMDPRRALGRVWQLVEDEQRLARENVLDRQVIPVDGKEELAEVGRLGRVAMFFRTGDGRVGQVTRQGVGWSYEVVTGEDAARVDELIESLKKQVRQGWFELPWALPEVQ